MLNLNSKGVVMASEVFALGMGVVFGMMTRPTVESFFKIDKKSRKQEKLSRDIEDEEIDDAE